MHRTIDFDDPSVISKLIVTMIEKTPVANIVLDRNFHVHYINDSFLKLRKMSRDDVLGLRCFDAANLGVRCGVCAVAEAMECGTGRNVLRKDVLADGTTRYIDDHALPLTDDEGNYDFILELMIDRSPVMRLRDEANTVFLGIIDTLIAILEKKDRYTSHHSADVCTISRKLAMFIGLSPDEVNKVTLAALLHDIGKVHIPDAIINKRGPLTQSEYNIVKHHPVESFELMRNLDSMEEIKHICLAHHERWDGTGYPNRTRKHQAPRGAYIVGLADAYDAMTSDRSYRQGMPHQTALAKIRNNLGKQFDPELGQRFLDMATFVLPSREELVSQDDKAITAFLQHRRREHKVTRVIRPVERKGTRVFTAPKAFEQRLMPLIFKHTPALYCLVDAKLSVLYASDPMAAALGYAAPHEMQGTSCTTSPTGDVACSLECGDCPAAAALRTGVMQTGSLVKTLDGQKKYFDMYAVPLTIADKKGDSVSCVMEILFDRTEETVLLEKMEHDVEALIVMLENLIVHINPEATTNADAIIRECGSFGEFLERMADRYDNQQRQTPERRSKEKA